MRMPVAAANWISSMRPASASTMSRAICAGVNASTWDFERTLVAMLTGE